MTDKKRTSEARPILCGHSPFHRCERCSNEVRRECAYCGVHASVETRDGVWHCGSIQCTNAYQESSTPRTQEVMTREIHILVSECLARGATDIAIREACHAAREMGRREQWPDKAPPNLVGEAMAALREWHEATEAWDGLVGVLGNPTHKRAHAAKRALSEIAARIASAPRVNLPQNMAEAAAKYGHPPNWVAPKMEAQPAASPSPALVELLKAARAVVADRVRADSAQLEGSDWKHSRISDSLTDELQAALKPFDDPPTGEGS